MTQIVLIRPGSTDYDEQGRIQGTLDIPLSEEGAHQVERLSDQLRSLAMVTIYSSCATSATQTAAALAKSLGVKHKKIENLQNLDHGLWQGMLLEDVKHKQPKVYRQWQEQPENMCPPEGEPVCHAQQRVAVALAKLCKKVKNSTVGLVVPEPLATLVHCHLAGSELGDLWKCECASAKWEVISIGSEPLSYRGVVLAEEKSTPIRAVLPNPIS